MNTEMDRVLARLEELEERCRQLEQSLAAANTRGGRLAGRLRVACGLGIASLMVAFFASPGSNAMAQGYGATLGQLVTRLTAVENKTQYVSVAGGEMYIDGTNLHLRNGLGATNGRPGDPFNLGGAPVVNGLGNLVIGYNALRGFGDVRTGSHTLIAGDLNNYASYGGLVIGQFNSTLAPYASVSGGLFNTASGFGACVSGGRNNTASGEHASVSGGTVNTASNFGASVSGGNHNSAQWRGTSISGGQSNFAVGEFASISGGQNRVQIGAYIWQGGALISGP